MGNTPLPTPVGSFELPDSAQGESGVVHRNVKQKGGPLLHGYFEEVTTQDNNFLRGLRVNAQGPCIGHRPVDKDGELGPFVWLTYAEVHEMRMAFGSGVLSLDLAPVSGDHNGQPIRPLGFYAKNCW